MINKGWYDLALMARFPHTNAYKEVLANYKKYAKTAHPEINIDLRRTYSNETIIGMMAELYSRELNPIVEVERFDKYNKPLHYKATLQGAVITGCLTEWQAKLGAHLIYVYYVLGLKFDQLYKNYAST